MKKPYVKPKIAKASKMTFPLDLIKNVSGKAVCNQCAGCHGCR